MDAFNNRGRIAHWLRALAGELGEAPAGFILRHVSINDRQVDVATFAPQPIAASDPSGFGDLVKRIGDALDTDADGLGGVQRYVVVAFLQDSQIGRLPLRCAGAGFDGGNDPIESEPATPKGLLSQLMRHNEAQSRMFALSMGQIVSTMQRTIARLQESADIGEERRLEYVALSEKLLNKQQKRDLKVREAEHELEMNAEGVKAFTGGWQVILNYLAGRGASQFSSLLGRLAKTLGPEQLDVLNRTLTREQAEMVNELFKLRQKVEKQEAESAASGAEGGAPVGTPDASNAGEPDAGGAPPAASGGGT